MSIVSNIRIIEKPDSVPWDDIHECLWKSHKQNRQNNIVMSFPALPGYLLKEKVESGNGNIFIALDGSHLIGTAAYTVVKSKYWFSKDEYAYLCLASILPTYAGSGIYKNLCNVRECECLNLGLKLFVFETHEHNKRVINIQKKNGFRLVEYKRCKDGHHNVILAKWYDASPFSVFHCTCRYRYSQIKIRFIEIIKKIVDKLCRR